MTALAANPHRFRFSRAGVLNVWQYDEQVFEFADGRLLLRGANGAGKSKTLEMLLPFVLDGDKARMTASGRHHTSLLWLMTDGFEGNRTGYLWLELARTTERGDREYVTCGVGLRASSSAKRVDNWFFATPRRVGHDLVLEDDAGPLTRDRLRVELGDDGQVFEQTRAYRQHVGRMLFGLEPPQYDELLRLLYWLRQPQVGEDIEPARLAEQLAQALPQVDEGQLRSAGDAFDELVAFGERLARAQRGAEAVAALASVYSSYAVSVSRERGVALTEAARELGRRTAAVREAVGHRDQVERSAAEGEQQRVDVDAALTDARARLAALESGPEARTHAELLRREQRALELADDARRAEAVAGRAAERAAASGARTEQARAALVADLAGYADAGHRLAGEATRLAPTTQVTLPSGLASPVLAVAGDVDLLTEALVTHAAAVGGLRPVLGELLAVVAVVDSARVEAEAAGGRREAEERRAAEAEQRAEQARGRLADAARQASAAEEQFSGALGQWLADPRAVPVDLPELTAATVPDLPGLAADAAAPDRERHREELARSGADRSAAERELTAARERRRSIEAEREPAPPATSLPRSHRDDVPGAPLWRLVDFAPELGQEARAGLEAALESAGLLDAWVRPDGALLDAGRLDVVLTAGPPVGGPTLLDLLLPDSSSYGLSEKAAGPGVSTEVVSGLLRRVALVDDATADGGADALPAVDRSGGWRLGPLVGRAAKPAAQYVGATARAAERARRLAEVDATIAAAEQRRDAAAEQERLARSAMAALEAWLAELPSPHPLLAAWARLDERTAVVDREETEARVAEESAARARAEAVDRQRRLEQLGATHGLPISAEGLTARRDQLIDLHRRIDQHVAAAAPLRPRLSRWADDVGRSGEELAEAEQLGADAHVAAERSAAEHAAARELRDAAGESIEALHQRMGTARAEIEDGARRRRGLEAALTSLREELGAARATVRSAQERLAEQQPVLAAAAAALAELTEVPGLVAAALDRRPDEAEQSGFALAGGVSSEERLPAPVAALARTLATLPEPTKRSDAAAVFAALQEALASDAAEHEPRVSPMAGDLLGAFGRDETGDHPVTELAGRLAAAVARDRELLTERERTQFEEHLVGELGDELRRRRQEAEDLVRSMNDLLGGVTTSQGIAVKLDWRLRDDVPEDVRRAVELLGRAVGSLLPGERAELRDALHRLIDAARAEAPEGSYTEHLTRALDYRGWFAFRIRYTRPELEGRWQELHRRSPLSQGEQKVVCYLPLFAAAAAHFTSLAGAAPHAPRFVLLDDAFPKIDVRTHPLLFGLLVALDLDFVVTSERLWGDHASVPSLAIYEALRDPGERGIAQYRYTWDGARLSAVGA
ncbi:MAG TPA: TIGR02680 family protein [Motilibacteraceae bacterium]|nr:TIGR02680 family protein [Motilibacteraceae bacterium]